MNIDISQKKLLSTPTITTRGFIIVNENEELIKQIEKKASEIINLELENKVFNYNDIKSNLISKIATFLYEKTGRAPIILPILMDVKKAQV